MREVSLATGLLIAMWASAYAVLSGTDFGGLVDLMAGVLFTLAGIGFARPRPRRRDRRR
jgi:hypothetical protein